MIHIEFIARIKTWEAIQYLERSAAIWASSADYVDRFDDGAVAKNDKHTEK